MNYTSSHVLEEAFQQPCPHNSQEVMLPLFLSLHRGTTKTPHLRLGWRMIVHVVNSIY